MKSIKIVLVLIIITLVAIFLLLDNIVKYSIEKYGSQVITTSVTVTEVESDIFEQSVLVSGVAIANPAEFQGNALTINNAVVDIDQVDDIIVINSINIDGIVANVVQNTHGINLMALKDAVSIGSNSNSNTMNTSLSSEKDKQSDMRIKIGSFAITQSMVNVDTDIIKEQIALPDISLRNIGGDNGMLVSEFTSYIIGYLVKEIKTILSKKGINMLEDKLKQTLINKIGDRLGIKVNTTDDIKNSLEESLSGTKENFQEKIKDLQNQPNKQKEKLKNIFKL